MTESKVPAGSLDTPDRSSNHTLFDVLAHIPPQVNDRPRPAVKRLAQADGGNIIAMNFAPGQVLPEHKAAHPITVQCLQGVLLFTVEGESITLTPGKVIHVKAGVLHDVVCPDSQTAEVSADSPAQPEAENVLLLTMLTGERH